MFKKCTMCAKVLEIKEFSVRKASSDGLNSRCKKCMSEVRKQEYQENAEIIKSRVKDYRNRNIEKCRETARKQSQKRTQNNPEYIRDYYRNNKDKWKYNPTPEYKARQKKSREKNKESIKKQSKIYYTKNKNAINKKCLQYKKANPNKINANSASRRAKSKNATLKGFTREIETIYSNAISLNLHVDHIIPLSHQNICGLHVPWNLQLITKSDNLHKSNSFDGTYENNSWKVIPDVSVHHDKLSESDKDHENLEGREIMLHK